MKLSETKNVESIFQHIEMSEKLPTLVQNMAENDIYYTGKIKYDVDFIEDCANLCSASIETGDGYRYFSCGEYAVYCDLVRQIIYINEATLALVENYRKLITLELR